MPRTAVVSPNVDEADPGLWSNCIRAGDFLFIAGQISQALKGREIVGNGEYEQTKHIFSRIQHFVEAAGGSMADIIKVTIFVTNVKNNTEVWRARREFFTGHFPASTLVEVSSLATPDQLVEIEAIAYLGNS